MASDRGRGERQEDQGTDWSQLYDIDYTKMLGQGGYGKTYPAKDRSTGELLACKIVDTSKMREQMIWKESEIMKRLDHPNIIKCKAHGRGIGPSARYYFIFMEMASNGELFDQVIDRGAAAMSEPLARGFFSQIIDALLACKQWGVLHRDLKLENVLLNSSGVVKLIDFGLSHTYPRNPATQEIDASQQLFDMCGSKSYAAPEVLAADRAAKIGYSGFGADTWSAGVCLFAMLSGFFPLDEATNNDWRFKKIRLGQHEGRSTIRVVYDFYKRPVHLSAEVVQLIDGLLCIDPAKRLTLEEVASHPWVLEQKLPPPAAFDTEVAMDDEPVYRALSFGAFEPSPMDDDEMPVYRSLGGMIGGGEEDGPVAPMPGLMRQKAFGMESMA